MCVGGGLGFLSHQGRNTRDSSIVLRGMRLHLALEQRRKHGKRSFQSLKRELNDCAFCPPPLPRRLNLRWRLERRSFLKVKSMPNARPFPPPFSISGGLSPPARSCIWRKAPSAWSFRYHAPAPPLAAWQPPRRAPAGSGATEATGTRAWGSTAIDETREKRAINLKDVLYIVFCSIAAFCVYAFEIGCDGLPWRAISVKADSGETERDKETDTYV